MSSGPDIHSLVLAVVVFGFSRASCQCQFTVSICISLHMEHTHSILCASSPFPLSCSELGYRDLPLWICALNGRVCQVEMPGMLTYRSVHGLSALFLACSHTAMITQIAV